MSMNLHFISNGTFKEFPYQTSTTVTNQVMKASTTERKLEIIKKDLHRPDWDRWSQECYDEIAEEINNGSSFGMS